MLDFIYYLIKVIVLCITGPIITFIHELGHAIPGLLLTDGDVTIQLGEKKGLNESKTIKIRRLKIKFNFHNCFRGITFWSDCDISEKDYFIIILWGPLASLIVFILLFLINLLSPIELRKFISVIILYDLYLLVRSLIPRIDPYGLGEGNLTDGYKIREYLISKNKV
ncbi:hypothetical protein [Clostridium sp. KNHs214]|uniref:hypothetical protein n=1 Tax=Clostridium sp. KNHs214 TaxID=1540257 RepID=UPI0005516AD9|nr:hypothetical protein [Clostridium sp. KNHs214]